LLRQLTRAASSVALNIAEGQGRMTARDRRHFATVARGSLCEVVACLQILRADGALPEGQFDGLMGQATEVLGLLNGLIARPGGVASRAEAL
jgi:four helix bundle protein